MWKMKKDDTTVDVFYKNFHRKILQMRWKDQLLRSCWRGQTIGHTLRQNRNNDCNIAFGWPTEGKRRTRGTPKTTSRRTVENGALRGRVRFTNGNEENRSRPRKAEDLRKACMCHEARVGKENGKSVSFGKICEICFYSNNENAPAN